VPVRATGDRHPGTGFSDIRDYPPGEYQGMVVLRPRTQAKPAVLALTAQLVRVLETEPLEGNL